MRLGVLGWCILVLALGCEKREAVEDAPVSDILSSVQYKEVSLPLRTVLYEDSILTLDDNLLLLGEHESPHFGRIFSESYANFLDFSINEIFAVDDILDSIKLRTRIDYTYGRKAGTFAFQVFLLSERLRTDSLYLASHRLERMQAEGEGILVVDSVLTYKEVLESDEEEEEGRVFVLDVEKEWLDLFNAFLTDEDNALPFATYPGMVFQSKEGENSQVIIGLNPEETYLSIYFHRTEDEAEEGEELTSREKLLGFATRRFNHFRVDRGQSALTGLANRGESLSLNSGYAQGASGVFCEIDLSPFYDFYTQNDAPILHRAELVIGPLQTLSSGEERQDLPVALELFLPQQENSENSWIYLSQNVNAGLINENSLYANVSDFFLRDSRNALVYRGSVQNSLRNTIELYGGESRWLLSSADNNSLNPIIIGQNALSLRIYYSD